MLLVNPISNRQSNKSHFHVDLETNSPGQYLQCPYHTCEFVLMLLVLLPGGEYLQ